MELELIKQYAELLVYFKAAVTLAIVLGAGCGYFFAMYRHTDKDNEKLQDCLNEAHEAADEAEKGHKIALATLAEERKLLESKVMR